MLCFQQIEDTISSMEDDNINNKSWSLFLHVAPSSVCILHTSRILHDNMKVRLMYVASVTQGAMPCEFPQIKLCK